MKSTAAKLPLILLLAVNLEAQLPDAFENWQGQPVETYSAAELDSIAGEDAPVLREYGVLGALRREYKGENNARLAVTLFELGDATESFGLFTYFREPEMGTVHKDDLIAAGNERLLIQHGAHLVDARGANLTVEDAAPLASALPPATGRSAVLPTLQEYFPAEGLVPHTQRLVLGEIAFTRLEKELPADLMGFDTGAEVAIARYRMDATPARMILISYATPQLAAKMFSIFLERPEFTEGENADRFLIQRKGSLVAFLVDAPSMNAAVRMLDRVQYESTIMWNEYVPPRSENVGRMMVTIFSLAGFVLLLAFVAGLAFGGLRVLVKRFIPIAVFDRPSQMEIIKLDLRDK